jgi:ABC-type sugar transport system ATPase subunit
MRRLSGEGVGIVFISHRMDEISEVGDRITVMRNGNSVGTLERGKWTPPDLVALMTGADEITEHVRERELKTTEKGELLLSARGVQLRPDSRPFDVDVRAGDLIGVAGLEGHGQDEFLEALRGAQVFAGDVVRYDGDRERRLASPELATKLGVVYVPRERGQSIFKWMSIRENFGLPTLRQDTRGGLLRLASTRARFQNYVSRLNIVYGKSEDAITTLSGGNQQKVVVARWLAANPHVLVLNDPTRGIDIGAKRDVYRLLIQLASEGVGIVMLSTEVDEHIELMDRVLVFRENELFIELQRDNLNRNSLISGFFGQTEEESSNNN